MLQIDCNILENTPGIGGGDETGDVFSQQCELETEN